MVRPISQNQIKNAEGVQQVDKKPDNKATLQEEQKNKKKKFFRNIFAGIALAIVAASGVFSYFYKPAVEESLAAQDLSSSDLVNIRNSFPSKYGFSELYNYDANGGVNVPEGALDAYFSQSCTSTDKNNIASAAGVSSNLDSLSVYDMAQFLKETKTYSNGKCKAAYDTAAENLKKIGQASGYTVSDTFIDGWFGVNDVELSLKAVDIETATKALVGLDGITAESVEDILNYRTGLKTGTIDLDDNGNILGGNVIFPDVMHLDPRYSSSNINYIQRKLGFVHAKDGNTARLDVWAIKTSSSPNKYVVYLGVRNGEASISSSGSLTTTTRMDLTEPIMEPALLAEIEGSGVATLSVNKTCKYRGTECYLVPNGVPRGSTVSYKVTVAARGGDVIGVNVKDYATSDSLSGVANIRKTKTGGLTYDSHEVYEGGHYIFWWVGDLDQNEVATLEYDSVLNEGFSGDEVKNVAQLYVWGYNNEENIYLPDADKWTAFNLRNNTQEPSLIVTKTCKTENGTYRSDCGVFEEGEYVYYKVTVQAKYADAENVTLEDEYDTIAYNSSRVDDFSRNVTERNDGFAWNIGDLDEDETRTITYRARVYNDIGYSYDNRQINNIAEGFIDNVEKDEDNAVFRLDIPAPQNEPDLEITKTCSSSSNGTYRDDCGTFEPGETVYYRITVRATDADAEDVTVEDEYYPDVFSSLSNFVDSRGSVNTNNDGFVWTIGDMDENDTETLTYRARIESGLSYDTYNNRQINNIAEGFIDNVEKDEDNAVFRLDIDSPQPEDPDLQVTKECRRPGGTYSDNCGTFEPGERVEYRISVRGLYADASNVRVEDEISGYTLNELFDYVSSFDESQGSATRTTRGFDWSIGSMDEGDVETLTFFADLRDDLGTSYDNDSVVNVAEGFIGNTREDDDSATFRIDVDEPQADNPELRIIKSCSYNGVDCESANVPLDAVVTYTLFIENYGDATAQDVEVEDDYDQSRLDIVSTGGATDDGNLLIWDIGDLTADSSTTRSYTARVTDDGQVDNTACVDASNMNEDTNSSDDCSDYDFDVYLIPADLDIDKECTYNGNPCAGQNILPGATVRYRITVTNDGQATATNVQINDDYDETRLTISDITNSGNDDGDYIRWDNLGNLVGGDSTFVEYSATILEGSTGTVANTACVEPTSPDECDDYNFDIGGSPLLDIDKICYVVESGLRTSTECANGQLEHGDTVEYVLTVENTGTQDAVNVWIEDDFPETVLSNIIDVTGGGSLINNSTAIRWNNLGTLTPGQSAEVVYRATIRDNVAGGTTVRNIAYTEDDQDDYEFVTVGKAIEIIKTCVERGTNTPCASADLKPGDQITYILTVRNPSTTVAIDNVSQVVDHYDSVHLYDIRNISNSGIHDGAAGSITWTDLGGLAIGQSLTLTFDASLYSSTVNPPIAGKDAPRNGTQINNVAVVTADDLTDQASYNFVVIITSEVIRTGAFEIWLGVVTAAVISTAGYYFFKTRSKTGRGFGGKRSQEIKL